MRWYRIQAAGAKPRAADIFIFGDIGESWWGEETVTAKKLVQELAALDVDELTVRVNSYGGSVSDGIAIYNALRRHPASKNVIVEGVAVSIASLIAMAGDTVDMPANTLMMIHAPWGSVVGNAGDMRETADTLDRYAQAMASSYARKIGRSTDTILPLLQDGADHWYTADEALAAGFADTVSDALRVAASIPDRFRSIGKFSMKKEIPLPVGSTTPPGDPPAPPVADNVIDIEAARDTTRRETLAAEQTRRRDIRALVTGSLRHLPGVQSELDACLDDPGVTAAQASQRILAALGAQAEPLGGHHIAVGVEAEQKWVQAGVQSILARAGKEKHDPQNPLRGYNLRELARASLEKNGIHTAGMAPLQMAGEALRFRPVATGYGQTRSDFSVLLETALHKLLLMGWEAEPDTWTRWCRIGTVSDLRDWHRYITGTIGNISTVNEAGEYTRLTIPDGKKEKVSAVRRGAIIGVTPEVIINDDMDFMTRVPGELGRGARRAIEVAAIALLEANPTMLEDSIALFEASTHANLASGQSNVGTPTVTLVDAGRQAIASQKDINGNDILGLIPTLFLGPLALGSAARVVNNSTYDPDAANKLQRANPVAGLFSDIIESPRLASGAWYMLCDPNVHPTIEVVFLDGQREPLLTEETEFSTSGRLWKVELPFGVGAVGWRGARKIPTS